MPTRDTNGATSMITHYSLPKTLLTILLSVVAVIAIYLLETSAAVASPNNMFYSCTYEPIDPALFNLSIDSKLRSCDLIKTKVTDATNRVGILQRVIIAP